MTDLKSKFIKYFQKSQGRNFVNFLTKEIDTKLEDAFSESFDEFFQNFAPSTEAFPVCVIANAKFAQNLISIGSELEILIAYKNVTGYNIENFLQNLAQKLENLGLNLKISTCELDEIFKSFKGDLQAKSSLSIVRLVCGSKGLYKLARDEINRLKQHKKEDFLNYHAQEFMPFDLARTQDIEPNIKTGFGGIDEVSRFFCILSTINGENTARLSSLKIDEKQLSQFNLNVDFLLSLRSALNLSQSSDKFEAKSVEEVSKILQTKGKKTLDNEGVVSQKMINCMRNLGLFIRFCVAKIIRAHGKNGENFTLTQLRTARLKSGLYQIGQTIYAPANRRAPSPSELLGELNQLRDIELNFDISAIFYIKKVKILKDEIDECAEQIKQILARNHTFCILKALLDAGELATFVKPLEHATALGEYDGYHTLSVDEHCVYSVKFFENIKDRVVGSLADNLCADARVMLKLALLLHDVGKGSVGDHSVVGSNIFRAYANKIALKSECVNTGVTLVKYHTLMSNVANREDIYSQPVIFSFISKLGDKQTLTLLYILSYCVINATNQSLYNDYTAKLLRELYEISYQSFDDETLLDEATRRVKKEQSITRNEDFQALSAQLKEQIFKIRSNMLFAKYPASQIITIATKANNIKSLKIDIQSQNNLSVEIISSSRLSLSALLGELAYLDLAYMEIYELFDEKFFIRLEFNATQNDTKSLHAQIERALKMPSKTPLVRPVIGKDELNFELNHSKEYARLNINAKDQRGLMAYVMSVFDEFGVAIASARIQTIKNRTRNLLLVSKNDTLCYNNAQILNLLISE